MAKRGAERDLNKDNASDQEEEEVEDASSLALAVGKWADTHSPVSVINPLHL
jgi:hypothetical protein